MTPPDDRINDLLLTRVWVLEGLDAASLSVSTDLTAPTGPKCEAAIGQTGEALVVRLPVDWTGGRTSRRAQGLIPIDLPDDVLADREGTNLELVTPLGLAPATLQFDFEDALWVYPAWDGTTVNAATLREDPGVLGRIARSLRLLHISGLPFEGRCDPFEGLDLNTRWSRDTAIGISVRTLNAVTDLVYQCREVLSRHPVQAAPCLNAAATEAYFDTGSRVAFMDWRTSCMGDPHFELAGIGARASLNAGEMGALLTAYFGTSGASQGRNRAQAFRLVAAYLRMLDLHGAIMDGRADAASETVRRRFAARLEACVMILESASWTGAMNRLRV